MTRNLAVRWLPLALLASGLAWAQQPAAPAAPAGPAGPAEPAADEKLSLDFKDTPIADVAKQLSEQLGELVLVEDGIDVRVTLTREVPKSQVMMAIARAAQLAPSRCVIFCTEDQAKGGRELKRAVKAKLDLAAETTLGAFAQTLETQTKVRMRCLGDTDKLKVPAGVGELDLVPALNLVAKQAGCKWVVGWLLARPDPAQLLPMLQGFNQMPADQRNAMFDGRFDQAIKDFKGKTPEERAQIVQKIVSGLDSFSKRLAGLDPQQRAQWSAAVTPLIERGVQRFVMLDAGTQAQLMPVLRAFQKLK